MSPGEAAVSVVVAVMALSWAVFTWFVVRVLIRLSAAQQETAQAVSVLAERLEQQVHERAAAGPADQSAAHEVRLVPSTPFVQRRDDTEQPRGTRVVGLPAPVVKVAAFGYGVRRAMTDRNPREVERRIKAELRADRAARRAYWRKARA